MEDLFKNRTVHPMLISERSEPFNNPNYIFELKMDGERCIAYLDPSEGVDLRNKSNARLLSHVPELSKISEQVSTRCILDGELIVSVDGVPDFFEIQRRALTTDKFKIQIQSSRIPAPSITGEILVQNPLQIEMFDWSFDDARRNSHLSPETFYSILICLSRLSYIEVLLSKVH